MINNKDNNNLDMNKPRNEKEFYVKKLEKYKELKDEQLLNIIANCVISSFVVIEMIMVIENYITLNNPNFVYNEYLANFSIKELFSGICLGTVALSIASLSVAYSVAKKAGLESRIKAIKKKLELLDLQNNQNNNYEEEKGRSL